MAPGPGGHHRRHPRLPARLLPDAPRSGNVGWAGLVAAVLLVAAVGAAGLSSWRAALVPAVAVPLSLVAATWVLHLRGETLTTMTLLGLAAASAVVVDDVVGDVGEIRRQPARLRLDGPGLSAVLGDVVAARRGPLLVAR